MATRWFLLLAAVLCSAAFVCAQDKEDVLPEIEDNNVIPDDEIRARVDEIPVTTRLSSTPVETRGPTSTTAPTSLPSTTPTEPSEASPSATPSTTTAPQRPLDSLSRFLSDIIQIPIAVLRSVGSLLSNTFSSHSATVGSNGSQSA